MSEPVARVAMPAASAAPEPPDEPPGLKSRFQGLRVTPHSRDSVIAAQQNSGVVVRTWMMPPASITRCTLPAVTSAISSLKTSDPAVQGWPATSTSSLTATGMPSSGRGAPPLPAKRASARRAACSASSKKRMGTALTAGSTASMRAIVASMSSTGESSRLTNSRRASPAVR